MINRPSVQTQRTAACCASAPSTWFPLCLSARAASPCRRCSRGQPPRRFWGRSLRCARPPQPTDTYLNRSAAFLPSSLLRAAICFRHGRMYYTKCLSCLLRSADRPCWRRCASFRSLTSCVVSSRCASPASLCSRHLTSCPGHASHAQLQVDEVLILAACQVGAAPPALVFGCASN